MLHRTEKDIKNIQYILDNLRPDDVVEMKTEYGENWRIVVEEYSKIYDLKIACDENGKPICMSGVVPEENNIGIVWLLTTKEIENHYQSFLNEAKTEIDMWSKEYEVLCNVVHKRNKKAIRWLKWLGFKFDNPLNIQHKDSLFFYKGIINE